MTTLWVGKDDAEIARLVEQQVEIFYQIEGDPKLHKHTMPFNGAADWCAARIFDTPGFRVTGMAAHRRGPDA